ncbi:hypothetical protein D3C87_1355500 [compost metagenome]
MRIQSQLVLFHQLHDHRCRESLGDRPDAVAGVGRRFNAAGTVDHRVADRPLIYLLSLVGKQHAHHGVVVD